MRTRIDHATVVTCRGDNPVVLEDVCITFAGGVITRVEPAGSSAAAPGLAARTPPMVELKGRPLGAVLIRMGQITPAQLAEGLSRQKTTHGVIGQTLVDLGYITDAAVEWALAVQAGRQPEHPLPEQPVAQVIDGRGKLVIPGLINTHHHLFQSLTRGMPAVQNACLFDWLKTLYPCWQGLTYEALRQAATVSLVELLLGGCTTTSDHAYLFPAASDVKIEAVLEAAASVGMRIHAGRGSMSMGASAGGLPPDGCVQKEDDILADCQRVIEQFHDPNPMALRRIDLAPCAPFLVTPELLTQTRILASQCGVLLHTHLAETLDEERFCQERFGVRPVEYLRRLGWLGPNVYLAHCVHLNEHEINLLAATATSVVHCPCSNVRLGSGIAPVRQMLAAGVKVGVGVDGSSSNDGGNLLAEARQALLLQRVMGGAQAFTTADAFRLATIGGAAVLNRPELGRIEPDCAADLVIYDAQDIAFAGAVVQDPLGALMLCQPPRPERVIIAGRTVVKDGQVMGLDVPRLVADFNQLVRSGFRGAARSISPT